MIAEFKIDIPKFREALSEIRNTHMYISELTASGFNSGSAKINKRHIQYSWSMLQEDYTNQDLQHHYKMVESAARKYYPAEYEKLLTSRIDNISVAFVSKAALLIELDSISLDEFYAKYRIQKNSRFGTDLIRHYFETCSPGAFSRNTNSFISTVQRADINNLDMIKHYIDALDISEYVDEINETLINLYGEPGTNDDNEGRVKNSGGLWSLLSDAQINKFLHWLKTRELKCYFDSNNHKLSFWINYFNKIKTTSHSEDGILIIELPADYVVVDLKEKPNQSYIYKKALFDLKYKQYMEGRENGLRKWPVEDKDIISLKDAQINGINKNVYIITYEGVGRLYTMEIIDNCLNK